MKILEPFIYIYSWSELLLSDNLAYIIHCSMHAVGFLSFQEKLPVNISVFALKEQAAKFWFARDQVIVFFFLFLTVGLAVKTKKGTLKAPSCIYIRENLLFEPVSETNDHSIFVIECQSMEMRDVIPFVLDEKMLFYRLTVLLNDKARGS